MTSFSPQLHRKFGEPELPIFGFNLPALLMRIMGDFPELLLKKATVWLRIQPTLATVHLDGDEVVINLHTVLNHALTPEQVIGFILRHELLHLVIPAREVDGHLSHHPPEYWDVEQKFPDRVLAWNWLILSLGSCLRHDKKQQRTFVKPNWKNHMSHKRPSLDQIMDMGPAVMLRDFKDKPLF